MLTGLLNVISLSNVIYIIIFILRSLYAILAKVIETLLALIQYVIKPTIFAGKLKNFTGLTSRLSWLCQGSIITININTNIIVYTDYKFVSSSSYHLNITIIINMIEAGP